MGIAYVHWESVPHVDTIERFSEDSLPVEGTESAGGAGANATGDTAAANGGESS